MIVRSADLRFETNEIIGPPFGGMYQILEEIAPSSTAITYKAHSFANPDVSAAIKLFKGSVEQDRVDKEVELLEEYGSKEYFVNFLGYGEQENAGFNYRYIATELVPEGSFAAEIVSKEVPTKEKIVDIVDVVGGVANALSLLHADGNVYRDLKPDNILIPNNKSPKLCDLGSVIEEDEVPRDPVVGTVGYIAPEAFDGVVVAKSDIFSLGAVAYQALTHEVPFTSCDPDAYHDEVERVMPIEPCIVNPNIPKQLSQIVMACLTKKPTARPTAVGVVNSLQNFRLTLNY